MNAFSTHFMAVGVKLASSQQEKIAQGEPPGQPSPEEMSAVGQAITQEDLMSLEKILNVLGQMWQQNQAMQQAGAPQPGMDPGVAPPAPGIAPPAPGIAPPAPGVAPPAPGIAPPM